MLQMLKLNDLLFRLFSNLEEELVEIPIFISVYPLVETVWPSASGKNLTKQTSQLEF